MIAAAGLPQLYGDEAKVKQILVNLLVNALKFTPPGGRVTLDADRSDRGGIRFTIQDTGIGMTDEQLRIAMTRFGRAENSLMHKHPGSGLGLPLSIDLVRLHGGSFDISSVVERGTRIVIEFPPDRIMPADSPRCLTESGSAPGAF